MRENNIFIASYYFPNWHPEPKNEAIHGNGWTEWELVKCARSRFPGHQQPKVPLWGYEDESKVEVMEKKIHAAADHGVDCFIFDWYYDCEGLYRERVLNEAFLKAKNRDRMKFAIMHCNHDRKNMHPVGYSNYTQKLAPSKLTDEQFETMTDYIIEHYFKHPLYWKIDGCPYFSMYSFTTFVKDSGGTEYAAELMERFRQKVKEAGFPNIHYAILADHLRDDTVFNIKKDESLVASTENVMSIFNTLEVKALTGYNMLLNRDEFPRMNLKTVHQKNLDFWKENADKYDNIPFYPVLYATGTDASPRTVPSDMFEKKQYPYSATLEQPPAEFKYMLKKVAKHLSTRPEKERIFLINCWNEWTEGAYLEPDCINGYAYLEAIRDVFGVNELRILGH